MRRKQSLQCVEAIFNASGTFQGFRVHHDRRRVLDVSGGKGPAYGTTPIGILGSLLMGLGGFTLFVTGWAASVNHTSCENPDVCEALSHFLPFSLALFLSGLAVLALAVLTRRHSLG